MGKKIFISYKHSDTFVKMLNNNYFTSARDYVDILENLIEQDDHIFKGERDNEDIGDLADTTIASKLGDKIFDSSITILLISKNMKDSIPEYEQWIPWEISYSLREQSRMSGRSKTNAIIAVVLPDEFGSYEYFIKENTCPNCNCRTLLTDFLFQILRDNMFNVKTPEFVECNGHVGNPAYQGYSSFIYSVKWNDFISDINKYLDISLEIKDNIDKYKIVKLIN